jgi:hypothetical protein
MTGKRKVRHGPAPRHVGPVLISRLFAKRPHSEKNNKNRRLQEEKERAYYQGIDVSPIKQAQYRRYHGEDAAKKRTDGADEQSKLTKLRTVRYHCGRADENRVRPILWFRLTTIRADCRADKN